MKKQLIIIIACVTTCLLQAMEKPFESKCSIRFSVPTVENPLAYPITMQVPVINQNRTVILPPIYKDDALHLKELFGNLLNPDINHTEGPSLFGIECKTTTFDIVALKKLAAFFSTHNTFTSVTIPEKKNDDKSLLEQVGDFFATKGQGPVIQFYAPDLDNKNILIRFEVLLPTKSRYFDLAPIDANHASYLKARLMDLYNIGLENGPSFLPVEVLKSLNSLQ
ncbi:hypothetical protein Noda2021_12480 [Candidatus Dependentiae bacterium Noda2021]|nr:hypothetical protein Noda2021_12480 [Candidatus Dependentiae bacterium Noda2021]